MKQYSRVSSAAVLIGALRVTPLDTLPNPVEFLFRP